MVMPVYWARSTRDAVEHRSEKGRTLVALRDEYGVLECRKPRHVQREGARFVHLIEPRRCVEDEGVPHFRWQFLPHARSKGHRFDKLLRPSLGLARLQGVDH